MVLIYVRFFVAVILDAYRSPRIQYCIQSLHCGIRSPLDLTLLQLPCKESTSPIAARVEVLGFRSLHSLGKSQLPQLQRGLRFWGLGPYTALQRVSFTYGRDAMQEKRKRCASSNLNPKSPTDCRDAMQEQRNRWQLSFPPLQALAQVSILQATHQKKCINHGAPLIDETRNL